MIQTTNELQITRSEIVTPLDSHIAEGIAIGGLFTAIHTDLVTQRLEEAFEDVRNPIYLKEPLKNKEIGHTIAYAAGKLALETEDKIDTVLYEIAASQNHGTRTIHTEQAPIGEIAWAGYNPNSQRLLKLIKRVHPVLMTNNELPVTTMWVLKAVPGRA